MNEISQYELFQNKTIRPILKLQHEALINTFLNFSQFKKLDFHSMNENSIKQIVQKQLHNNSGLLNCLIGIVIGMMTITELHFFFEHQKEYRKRCNQLLLKRITSTLQKESIFAEK